jgi:hypothetical protein
VSPVLVRLVRVVPCAAEDPRLLARLGDEDWKTIASLGFEADRDRAVTARAAARLELGRRLGVRPRVVPLLARENAQPVVRGTSIGVSWSHSGDWVALAFARDRPVGVDLELIPEELPARALALIGVRSLEEFVAREAAGKASGEGLAATWPTELNVRPFEAPAGYVGAVAAPGHYWSLQVEPWVADEPPTEASAQAIGLWDVTGAGSRNASSSR